MSYGRQTISMHSLAPDLIPQDAPAEVWNNGNNVVFKNNESVRVTGDSAALVGATVGAETMIYMEPLGVPWWVYANDTGVFAHDGNIEFDITPAGGWTGGGNAVWTSCVLNGIAYINASDRDPIYWSGDSLDLCLPLPDWPTNGRCLALRAHKNFLFAIGFISEGYQRVRWSDAAAAGEVPGFWAPAASNLAGFVDLAPLSSPVLDGMSLRDDFLMYKEESIWAATFVGGNDIFNFRKRFSEHGLMATNGITNGPNDNHLFVGDDGDLHLTDGVQVQSVLDGRAQRTFYADVSQQIVPHLSAVTLAREKLGIVIYEKAAGGKTALLFDFTSGDIAWRDMPDVLCAAPGRGLTPSGVIDDSWDTGDAIDWDTGGKAWLDVTASASIDDVLIGGDFGFLQISGTDAKDFSTGPVLASLEKSGLAMGSAQTRKTIARLWPKVIGVAGDILTFRIGGQEYTGGPTTWSAALDYVIGSEIPLDTFIQGRFFSFQVSSNGGSAWRLGSMDVELRGAGAW